MSISVYVSDTINAQPAFQRFKLKLVSETLTAGELIESRVRKECASDIIKPLVQSKVEKILNESKDFRQEHIDKQVKIALQGFSKNKFLLFVDDKQIQDINEKILLKKTTEIQFLLLIQLQGG